MPRISSADETDAWYPFFLGAATKPPATTTAAIATRATKTLRIRRATGPDGSKAYVVRLSKPPTLPEQLQLLAARLERRPIVIMPHKSATVDEWMARYGR